MDNSENLIQFCVYSTAPDDSGNWNPDGLGPYLGGLQVSIHASTDGYRALAAWFQRLADQETGDDPHYHKHHGPFLSLDEATRVELILRKDDPRFPTKKT